MTLSERQKQILSAVVEEYIRTGEPVGSKRLSQILEIKVSPATIRSDMAYLYDIGLLEQPHTSAGRVPSHVGIREYLDDLIILKPLSVREKNAINSLFNVRNPDPDKLLRDAAEALSHYTGYASMTSSYMPTSVTVRRLEFIIASENAIVIVLVASNGSIGSKVVRVDFRVTVEIMEFFQKFANARFLGRSIDSITQAYISSVSMTLGEYSRIFTTLLVGIYELCKEMSDGRYFISGATKLIGYSEEGNPKASDILRILESHDMLQELFNPELDTVQVFVGKENTFAELTGSTIVMTHYAVGGEPAGSVGVVGPVRLDYAHVIPHLEYFAQVLGDLMTDTLLPGLGRDDR